MAVQTSFGGARQGTSSSGVEWPEKVAVWVQRHLPERAVVARAHSGPIASTPFGWIYEESDISAVVNLLLDDDTPKTQLTTLASAEGWYSVYM